ncbi:MAG: lyase family protein [Geminicoccaceae bacterium]
MRGSAVPVPALLRQLRGELAPQLRPLLHLGATSQDIVDTALVLQLGTVLDLLAGRLRAVLEALLDLAGTHERTVMLARTRFQPALPTTFGVKVAGWLLPLARHLARLGELRPRLLVVQLGGAAGTLAPLGDCGTAVMDELALELGLASPPMPWHSQRDGLLELAAWLAQVAGLLGKLGTDVLLLAQGEVAEAREAAGGGSSTLPQKANPIRAEALVTWPGAPASSSGRWPAPQSWRTNGTAPPGRPNG